MSRKGDRTLVKRYTQVDYAREMLAGKRLVLPKPSMWDDRNDLEFIDLFKRHGAASAIHVLCFTNRAERYHHWKNHADGASGICLEFDKNELERELRPLRNVRYEDIAYVAIEDFEKDWSMYGPENLPFLKRVGFRDEDEWRIVHTSHKPGKNLFSFPFKFKSLNRIILNPWLDEKDRETQREEFRSLVRPKLRIQASYLTNSERWKAIGRKIALKAKK